LDDCRKTALGQTNRLRIGFLGGGLYELTLPFAWRVELALLPANRSQTAERAHMMPSAPLLPSPRELEARYRGIRPARAAHAINVLLALIDLLRSPRFAGSPVDVGLVPMD